MGRRFAVPLVALAVLAGPGAARADGGGKSWATGVITRIGAAGVTVRGTVTLLLTADTRYTLDGTHAVTCTTKPRQLQGFRVGSHVKVACFAGALTSIH